MPSFGEIDIVSTSGTTIGRFRILNMFAGSALFPRIQFTIGCTLDENPHRKAPPAFPGLQLHDLRGDLRLASGELVGRILWTGMTQTVLGNAYEAQLDMSCDIDLMRLEEIERRRDGGELIFLVRMWPQLKTAEEVLHVNSQDIRAEIPRNKWLEALSSFRKSQHFIIEITAPGQNAEAFRSAYNHLCKAQDSIDNGIFDPAVISCRHAMEAVIKLLPQVEEKQDKIEKFVESALNDKRGQAYRAAASALRRFFDSAAHDYDPLPMSRAEACFVLATTAHLISVISNLEAAKRN